MPVEHVQNSSGTAFFRYINGTDEANGGGGESLTHLLFKEAIAGLSGTKLALDTFGEHDITITHGETEKEIRTDEGPYYADVYLRFTSNTRLGLKWSGEIYIEVNHTHAVPPYKLDSLRQARLPVVEVDVPNTLVYDYENEYTTDPREAAHIRRIQNMLQKGFLAGRVISDRSSVEFLEQEVDRLAHALEQTEKDCSEEKRRSDAAIQRLGTALERESGLTSTVVDLTLQTKKDANTVNELGGKFEAEKSKNRKLAQSLSDINKNMETQQVEIRHLTWTLYGILALIAILGAYLLYQRFITPHANDNAGQATSLPTVEPVASSPVSGKTKKVPLHPAQGQRAHAQ